MDVGARAIAAALAALALVAAPAAAAPGDLDPSFSGDGRVSTLSSPDTFVARAVAVQPDGRIVVAGYSCDTGTCGPTGDSSFRLQRYTADGGLDPGFGAGGRVGMRVGDDFDAISDLLLAGDRLVAVGQAEAGGRDRFALAR